MKFALTLRNFGKQSETPLIKNIGNIFVSERISFIGPRKTRVQ